MFTEYSQNWSYFSLASSLLDNTRRPRYSQNLHRNYTFGEPASNWGQMFAQLKSKAIITYLVLNSSTLQELLGQITEIVWMSTCR